MRDTIHLRVLLIKAHFGELTAAEKEELDELLAIYKDESRQIQEEIASTPKEEVNFMLEDLDLEDSWQKVLEKESQIRHLRVSQRRNWIVGGAIAASVILAGFFLFKPERPRLASPDGVTAVISTDTADQATLRLASGKLIMLSDSGQQLVAVGNAHLSNTNRVLKLADLSGNPVETPAGWNTITVPNRLDYKIELPDGTMVWLNSTTKFRFPLRFSGKSREVYLEEGEAYFHVAQQADAPFVVHSGEAIIQVLGTEFNVNAYEAGKVITSLVNGKVAVAGNSVRKELVPNQEAIIINNENGMRMQSFDVAITTSWRRGIHYFRNAPVSDIALMLSRWFGTGLVIDNPRVANVQFRGRLDRNRPLSDFVEEMNLTGDATFYWREGVLHCK